MDMELSKLSDLLLTVTVLGKLLSCSASGHSVELSVAGGELTAWLLMKEELRALLMLDVAATGSLASILRAGEAELRARLVGLWSGEKGGRRSGGMTGASVVSGT